MVGRVCIPLKTWTSVYDTKLIHFHSHILFLYHLKTSKNLRFSVFMEHRSGIFDWKLVKRAKLFSEKITWPNSHYSTKKYWNLKNGRFILFIHDKTNTLHEFVDYYYIVKNRLRLNLYVINVHYVNSITNTHLNININMPLYNLLMVRILIKIDCYKGNGPRVLLYYKNPGFACSYI